MTERPRLRFFLDQGVPNSVGRAFEESGHYVIYGNRVLMPRDPDQKVCVDAQANNCILVAVDRDMRRIAKENGVSQSRFAALSFVHLMCNEVAAAQRVREAMSLIEHEWTVPGDRLRRLHVEILPALIRTRR